jgi:hypothetical protein
MYFSFGRSDFRLNEVKMVLVWPEFLPLLSEEMLDTWTRQSNIALADVSIRFFNMRQSDGMRSEHLFSLYAVGALYGTTLATRRVPTGLNLGDRRSRNQAKSKSCREEKLCNLELHDAVGFQ